MDVQYACVHICVYGDYVYLYMAFVFKLHEGEGASPGIYGLIAVFVILAFRSGTVFFSPVPWAACRATLWCNTP